MSLPFTSVVSLHQNPMTCGVAKFSSELAKRLDVPFRGFDGQWGNHPLLSLKWSEFSGYGHRDWARHHVPVTYSVFWHDAGDASVSGRAAIVYHADPSLGINGLWCPSLLTPSKPRTVRLFSFGMAHKLQPQYYAKVRQLLEAAGLDYELRVSVGLHEGTSLDDATQHFDALKQIMGADKVTILGILSDDAVVEELERAKYVLAFFDKGLRANNTTVHAALAYNCAVITNHDTHTPDGLGSYTENIHELRRWPVSEVLGWDPLLREMDSIYARTLAQPTTHR